jgi:hypothetical protein
VHSPDGAPRADQLLGGFRIDASLAQPSQSLCALLLVESESRLVARFQTLLHKRQKDRVLLVAIVEKGAGVASAIDGRSRQLHGSPLLSHGSAPAVAVGPHSFAMAGPSEKESILSSFDWTTLPMAAIAVQQNTRAVRII